MVVNEDYLIRKVSKLNDWLQNHPESHYLYSQKKRNRDYYVNKLCDMHDLGLKTIQI